MSEFSDIRSITGRIGALTVIGDLRWGGAILTGALYEGAKLVWTKTGYHDLSDLRELYALRWTSYRFPGDKRASLIFETVFHGDWDQYLSKLVRRSASGIDIHARFLTGYPGAKDVEVFLAYLVRHHHPAAHVYAANPMISPTDIDQFMPPNEAAERHRMAGRWLGAIVPLREDCLVEVRELLDSWDVGDTSPFRCASLQHGRVVIIERTGKSYLHLSAVYVAEKQRSPYRKRSTDRDDRTLFDSMINPQSNTQWLGLLKFTEAQPSTREAAVELLMAHRSGRKHVGPIRWVDWCWSFDPTWQQSHWTPGTLRRMGAVTEQSLRPDTRPK